MTGAASAQVLTPRIPFSAPRVFPSALSGSLATPSLTGARVLGVAGPGITNDRVYRATFGSPNYSFTRGGWRFVVVDSSAGRITAAQLDWLKRELRPAMPTVVFTHIPPVPLSEWTDWGALKGAGGLVETVHTDGGPSFPLL